MQAAQISEILAQYKKHGWILRRVLLSSKLKNRLSESDLAIFEGGEIISSEIDAVWFSRPAKGGEAWELRRLSEFPYARLEIFSDEDDEEIREEARREIEAQPVKTS